MAELTTLWLSASSDYEDFEEGVDDADSFSVTIPTTNSMKWVIGTESLLIGTSGDEWRMYSPKLDSVITPTNFKIAMQSGFGSNYVQPILANATVLFVSGNGRRIHELAWDDLKQKYVAPDMTLLAEHITDSGIIDMALQKAPDMIVWCILDDGRIASFTYDRDQNITAWSQHPIGDAEAQSVCIAPNSTTGEDEITFIIKRTIDSTTYYYMEKFNPRTLPDDIADCFFVDCGITYSGVATNVITGLIHLKGESVDVLASGGTSGDYTLYEGITVSATGTVTLPTIETVAQTATKAQIGLSFDWKLEPMRLDISGGNNTAFGSIKKIPEVIVSFVNSAGVEYGDGNTTYDVNFDDVSLVNHSTVDGLFTGDTTVQWDGGFSVDDALVISGSSVYPVTIRCLIPKVEVTGR